MYVLHNRLLIKLCEKNMVTLVERKSGVGDEALAESHMPTFVVSLPLEIFAKVIDSVDVRSDPLHTIRALLRTSRRMRERTFGALTHLPVFFNRFFYALVSKGDHAIIDQVLLKNLKATPYTHLEVRFYVGHPSFAVTPNFLQCMEKVMRLGCKCALIGASMKLTEEAIKPFDLSRFTRLCFEHCRHLAPSFFVQANYSTALEEIDLTDTQVEKEGFLTLLTKCRKLEKIQMHYTETLDSRSLITADFPETLCEFAIENHDFSSVHDEDLEKANSGLSQAILALRHARKDPLRASRFLLDGKKILPKLSVFADIENIIAGRFSRRPPLKARYYRLLLAANPSDLQTQVDLFRADQKYEKITGGRYKKLRDYAQDSLYALAALLLAYIVDRDFIAHDRSINKILGRLEKAVEKDPSCDFAFAALAYAHLCLEKKQQALEYAKRSLALNPANELTKAILMNTLEDDTSWAYFKELSGLAFHSIEVNMLLEQFIVRKASFHKQIEESIAEQEKRVGLHDTLLSLKILSHVHHTEKIDEAYLAPYTAALLKDYPENYFAARYRLCQQSEDE